ncbi:hypothetical protein ACWEQP_23360 [Streptomyces sp. NPDC004044]
MTAGLGGFNSPARPRIRPPGEAGRNPLPGRFDMQRAVIHLKCEGLSEADAYRAVLPEQQ